MLRAVLTAGVHNLNWRTHFAIALNPNAFRMHSRETEMRALKTEEFVQVGGGDRWGLEYYSEDGPGGGGNYDQVVTITGRRDGVSLGLGDVAFIAVGLTAAASFAITLPAIAFGLFSWSALGTSLAVGGGVTASVMAGGGIYMIKERSTRPGEHNSNGAVTTA